MGQGEKQGEIVRSRETHGGNQEGANTIKKPRERYGDSKEAARGVRGKEFKQRRARH